MASIASFLDRIHLGDCLELLDRMPRESVDLAFADPPFNIGYDYDVYRDDKDREDYLAWSRQWLSKVHSVLKPSGSFWLAIGDEYAAELKLLSQEVGFYCRSWVVWYYTFGVNCKAKFSRSHAHLFYFTKHPTEFTFRSEAAENRIPSARQLVYADARANPRGRLPDDTWVLRPQDLADCFTASEDTWYFPRVAGTFKERAGFHGCQMPEQLLGRIIRACSHEGDIVLDPFSGSATTLAVAKKLGRRPIGLELSQEYVTRGTDRLRSICVGDPLDGSAEPTVSAPATPRSGRKGKLEQPAAPVAQEDTRKFELFATGIVEAFREANQGFSVDRVVADPELNQSFGSRCLALGLPGDLRNWNRVLFQLRKMGRLADIPTTRRTAIGWSDCDPFLYACEIALRTMLDDGCDSLDEILCDPELAARFDSHVQQLAPGVDSFWCRWGALKLRKDAKAARVRAALLKAGRFGRVAPIESRCWESLPESAAVYVVHSSAGETPIYAGSSLNLRNRFRNQFAARCRRWWDQQAGDGELQFRYFTSDNRSSTLLAYQVLLVDTLQPRWNLLPA